MFAIVEIAGLQYKVEQDQRLYVNRLPGEKGDKISFDKVLLTNNGSITIGAPVISGIAVQAEILDHLQADKVIVFKKKRRKGYAVKNGHRQQLTQIQVVSISGFEEVEKPKAKKEAAPKKEKVAEPKAAAPKKTTKTSGDKLSLIEGIGPKVAEIFVETGITTFAELSAKSKEELKAILEAKGGVYAGMDPATWPKQAKLAADGKMDELKALQEELKSGK